MVNRFKGRRNMYHICNHGRTYFLFLIGQEWDIKVGYKAEILFSFEFSNRVVAMRGDMLRSGAIVIILRPQKAYSSREALSENY